MTTEKLSFDSEMEGPTLTQGTGIIEEPNTFFGTPYLIPRGYVCRDRYLGFKGKIKADENPIPVKICDTPCMITGYGRVFDSETSFLEVSFYTVINLEKRSVWVPHSEIFTKKGIHTYLINKDFTVIEREIHNLTKYLSECYSLNSQNNLLKHAFIAESNGWVKDNQCFILGNKMFCKNGMYDVVTTNDEISKGLEKKGTVNEWIDANKELLKYPTVRFVCYSAMASTLLSLLGVKSFFVDMYGESSTGKTTTDYIAMSQIGNPKELVINANSTVTALEILANRYCDLPIFIDETSLVKQDKLQEIIYLIANEKGKGRGHKEGGLRETKTWKCVALSSGEQPITSTFELTGQKVRVIEIKGGIGNKGNEFGKIVTNALTVNEQYSHGHIIEPFIIKLFQYKDELQKWFSEYKEQFAKNEENIKNRFIDYFAAVSVAGRILEEVYNDIGIESVNSYDIITKIYNESVASNDIENYSIVMLRQLQQWITSHNAHFMTDMRNTAFPICVKNNERQPLYGWHARSTNGAEVIDIIPKIITDEFLPKDQKNKISILKQEWKELGILETNNNDKNEKKKNEFYKTANHVTDNNQKLGKNETVLRFNKVKVNQLLQDVNKEKYDW